MSGALVLVPTPIGAVSDASPHVVEVLATADLLAVEDTRVTAKLLHDLGLPPRPMISTHDHNEEQRAADLVRRVREGQIVALVSDAGTPLVSDPGYRVVCAALAADLVVRALPGPCAAITALVGSGLPPDRFLFVGFLPREPGARDRALADLADERATLVLYEAPHRVVDTLEAAERALGERRAVVARSLTKVWEEWLRGTPGSLAARFRAEGDVRGELTLVIEGRRERPATDARVEALIAGLVAAGVPVGTVRDVVADVYALPRREVYQRALRARGEDA